MSALEKIKRLKSGDFSVLKSELWLKYLWFKENKEGINVENRLKYDLEPHDVLFYVERTLEVLESSKSELTDEEFAIIEEVLCWSEVAKCGNRHMRAKWLASGYILDIHNIGSKQIYEEANRKSGNYRRYAYVSTLIETHGMIGQYLRGEVSLFKSAPLAFISYPNVNHARILIILNKCIIAAVSPTLYSQIELEVNSTIYDVLSFKMSNYVKDRLKKLRSTAIKNGEDFEAEYFKIWQEMPEVSDVLEEFFSSYDLWYVEAATSELSLQNVIKLFVYVAKNVSIYEVTDISFESMMSFYCNFEGKKQVNIFKSRFIERLLSQFNPFAGEKLQNEHLSIELCKNSPMLKVTVKFSEIAEKFVEFCMASIGKGPIYDKVVVMACDNFGLRRDQFDRLTNEESYLSTMNSSISHKVALIEYVKGDFVVDIGPGGGALMDEIVAKYPEKTVIGVDASSSVVQELKKKKAKEGKAWNVMLGDALELEKIFKPGEVSTIIFCSILHEIYSYVEFEGKKFNYQTLMKAFKSVYNILPVGGRLLIRDGVMTDSDRKLVIQFKDKKDMRILENYQKDFKGREIEVEVLSEDMVKMPINDAMEFLYTYTWGEDSYAHEINEQFGYFTPNKYVEFLQEAFDGHLKVVHTDHYLQQGYAEHLSPKVSVFDEDGNSATLPDSTILLIVEKT